MQILDYEYLSKYHINKVYMISQFNFDPLINIEFKNGNILSFSHSNYDTFLNVIDGKVNEYYINKRFQKIQKVIKRINK